jgi:ABC-2 type transport system ATP-binding protein
MTKSAADIVKVENIVKDFRPGFGLVRKRVLHGISFSVRQGEIFGFVGPNGAGKTTTLKILMGLIHAQGGSATILGHDIGENEYRKHVGFLPENPYFYDFLTGNEFLNFYARVAGVPAEQRGGRINSLLEQVGLAHAADARLRTYSKGMLQRIGIAQAIVHDPDIVFLDEPMSGLDPIGRKEIRDLILRLNGEGKTIFMNTHILSDVEMLCHRVAILVKGKIRYVGSSEEFLASEERAADVVLARLPADAVTSIEERFGVEMRGQGDHVEIRVPEKDVADLLRLALDTGSEIVSVTPHRVSLEAIFLSAVHADSQQDEAMQEENR